VVIIYSTPRTITAAGGLTDRA